MIDLRRLRDDADYRAGIERKRVGADLVDATLRVDDERRVILTEIEELRARQNTASKEIGRAPADARAEKIAAATALKQVLAQKEPALAELDEAPARAGAPDPESGRRLGARRW